MKFIETVDEQRINTHYITSLYCEKDLSTLTWTVRCRVVHDRGYVLDSGLKDEQTALRRLEKIIRRIEEVEND